MVVFHQADILANLWRPGWSWNRQMSCIIQMGLPPRWIFSVMKIRRVSPPRLDFLPVFVR